MNKSGTFHTAQVGFDSIDAGLIRTMVSSAADFVVVLSPEMMVERVYLGAETLGADQLDSLRGRPFDKTLTPESLTKFAALVDGARVGDRPRWRQLNHVASEGPGSFPVRYAAMATPDGRICLMGRDTRELAALQQRLVQAQMTIEQDYERIRQVESRYRVLFETGVDCLIILAADTARIVDVNSAAARMLDREQGDLLNRNFRGKIATSSIEPFQEMLDAVRNKGGQRSVALTLKADGRQIWLDALLFRSVSDTLVLCRLRPHTAATADQHPFLDALMDLYDRTGDAIVFTDKDGMILRSNSAFHSLTNVAVSEALNGQSLATYLGRPTVDLEVMTANAERSGRLSIYATTLRSEYGAEIPVEISTTYLPDQQPPGFAFLLRDVSRLEASRQSSSALTTEAVEHVIDLVGSTPLKELVRSTTDVVEKLCIETALRLTHNNRAAAAEMLGLSRQSLYVKLRRFNIGDPEG